MPLSGQGIRIFCGGVLLLGSACTLREKGGGDAVAASCGGTCPAGTWRDEVRQSRSRDATYVDFVEGSCTWSCVALTDCPAGTVPVITEDCFTCARAMPSGSLAGGSCDPEDWFRNRDDTPDGQTDTIDIGGSADREEAVAFTGLSFIEAWEVDYQPRALAAYGGFLYVADHAPGELHRLDAQTGEELDVFSLGEINARDLAASGSRVFVAGRDLYAFELGTGEQVGISDEWEWEGVLAFDGEYLLEVNGARVTRRDPDTLLYFDDYTLESPLLGPAAWAPGRPLGADVLDTSPYTWRFPIYDLRDTQSHPLDAVLSLELDASPAHGMAVLGDRMYVTGAFDGERREMILVLGIE